MEYTDNLNLRKPENADSALIGDLNTNMDTLDSRIGSSGIATLTSGSYSTQVTHNFTVSGAATEPDWVEITPMGDLGYWYISSKSSTTFTVRFAIAPASNVQFFWRVGK